MRELKFYKKRSRIPPVCLHDDGVHLKGEDDEEPEEVVVAGGEAVGVVLLQDDVTGYIQQETKLEGEGDQNIYLKDMNWLDFVLVFFIQQNIDHYDY